MILIFGDSLATGLHLNDDFHVEKFPGSTSEQLLNNDFGLDFYLDETDYSIVIIIIGSNDLGHSFSENETIKNILLLHQIAWKRNLKTIVVGLQNKIFNNKLLQELNNYNSTKYSYCNYLENLPIDKTIDGLHLTQTAKNEFSKKLEMLI
ncbi:superfamily protein [Moumouvirus goulette]|uniref:Superfamily protein n=1 Tax=Moumouvirus goulette TaxID=1247379 RepID=M1PCK3_9VIRU|nr:superfamily protein [Moumouvirus goulette]AGF85719.1 superfamily protein [Moumouvirus goulette]